MTEEVQGFVWILIFMGIFAGIGARSVSEATGQMMFAAISGATLATAAVLVIP